MSRLIDFINSILGRLKKADIVEDLEISIKEIKEGVIPTYKDALKYFQGNQLRSKVLIKLQDVFARNLGFRMQQNIVVETYSSMHNVLINAQYVLKKLEEVLEHDVIKEGLTAQKSTLIRCAEQVWFLSRYSMDVLSYIYIYETIEYGGDANLPSKRAIEYIEGNMVTYAKLLGAYSLNEKDFKEMIDGILDVVVNEKTAHALSATFNEKQYDPIPMPITAHFENNPIYHIRLVIAEWQANRYKAFKEKKRMLELRLLNLQMVQDETPDPKVQHEIDYIQSRIDGIEYKMKRMEEA